PSFEGRTLLRNTAAENQLDRRTRYGHSCAEAGRSTSSAFSRGVLLTPLLEERADAGLRFFLSEERPCGEELELVAVRAWRDCGGDAALRGGERAGGKGGDVVGEGAGARGKGVRRDDPLHD